MTVVAVDHDFVDFRVVLLFSPCFFPTDSDERVRRHENAMFVLVSFMMQALPVQL